jgi:peptide/nickel transport system substrate-binding protein
MLYFRYKDGDEFRYCKPKEPMILGEAAHSIYMLQNPPKRGGNLTIGMAQEPKTLFFNADTMSAMTQVTSCLANGTVGGFDENWCLYPILIKRVPTVENGLWKIFDDGKRMEVTYELRKGMKWSDGVEITAKDSVFSFYLGNHPAFPTVHSETDRWIDKVEAADDYTVKVYWNTQYLYANLGVGLMPAHYFNYEFNYSLNDPNYYITDDLDTEEDETFKSDQYKKDEDWISKIVESEYKERPLHCGPYKVKSWERGQTIILEANDLYVYGRPLIDTITFRTIENTDTLLASALAGNVDMTLVGLTFDQAQQIVKRPDTSHRAVFTPSLTWEHIDLNIDDPVLADVRVRKALLHSIDREAIVNQFFEGKNTVSDSWLPPKHPGFDEALITKYEFSMEKANQLLDEAGWTINPTTNIREKDGKKLSITFMTTAGNKSREQVQAVIASNWRDVGIDVITKNENSTSFFNTTLQNRKFDGPSAVMYAWIMGPNSNLFSIVNGTQIPNEKNGFTGQNYTGINNEIINTLTEEIHKSMNKKDIYQKLQECQKILTEELPSLPLYTRIDVTSVNKNLKEYKPTGTQTSLTWNIEYWYWINR